MADNLTISIGADTSKLRGEIELVEAQIQNLRRLARGALRKDDAAGAAEYTNQIGKLRTNLVGLNRTLEQTGVVAAKTSRGIAISARSFRSLDSALIGVSRNFGAVGIAAFGAYRVFSQVSEQIAEARKRLLEIRDISQQTLQKPAIVKGAEDIAKSLGQAGEVSDKILGGIAESFAKVRTGVASAGAAIKDGQSTIEQGVQVLRGGDRPVFDLANAYQMLGINQRNYKGTAEDILRLQKDTMAAFQRASQRKLFDPVQLNELSKVLFQGVPAEAAIKVIPKLLQDLAAAAEKNKNLPDDIANQEALDAATNRITKMVDDQIAEHNRLWTYVQTRGANALADFVEGLPKWVSAWEQWKEGNKRVVERFFHDLTTPTGQPGDPVTALIPKGTEQKIEDEFAPLPGFFSDLTSKISNLWKSLFGGITEGSKSAVAAVSNAASAAEQAVADMTKRTAAATGGGGAYGVTAGRGGISDLGGHGPGSRPTQSITPGLSDYQAPPPLRIDMSGVARGAQWSQTAAEASADAAAASKSAAEASKLAVQGWVDPSARFAAGGMIRGPGTGTSDSIMARLSNGEFVMRAAAVQHWGAGFLGSLNRFAGGGLVMPQRSLPRFADGGLVAAGGGTGRAVHLHLGGSEFALSGANNVVDALVTEASRQRMRSGGLKPSWYGGRVSG